MAVTREWLLDDSPSSRLQARLGRGYRVLRRAARAIRWRWSARSIVLVLIVMALFAPWIATHSATGQNLSMRLMPPSAENWMGTDELGRDIWSRVVFGARITLVDRAAGGGAGGAGRPGHRRGRRLFRRLARHAC